jgi:1,4-alpha-glucan branching enzyme
MRAFVNEVHVKGVAVILDVVYNHLGPDPPGTNQISLFGGTDPRRAGLREQPAGQSQDAIIPT